MKHVKQLVSLALALLLALGMMGVTAFAAGSGTLADPHDGGNDYGDSAANSIILHKLDIGKFERDKAAALIAANLLNPGSTVTYTGNLPTGGSLSEGDIVGSYTTSEAPGTPVNVTLGELAALSNIIFRIQQVQLIAGKTPGSVDPDDYELSSPGIDDYAKTAATTGQIDWTNLPSSYYKITEEDNETGKPVGVSTFIVSVPMVDPLDAAKTVNTVHIYPKNRAAESPDIEKEKPALEDFNGNILSWTVRAEVPASLKPSKGSQKFIITDTMSKGITYAGNLKVYYKSSGIETPLTLDTDYSVTAAIGGTTLVVELLDDGFSVLGNALDADGIDKDSSGRRILYVEYDTTVNITQEEMEAGTTPENDVKLEFTNNGGTNFESHPDPVEVEHYAGLKLIKKDGANETVLLPGAKFKVYTKLSGSDVDPASAMKDKDGVELEFTTNNKGEFFYGGLGAGDYYLVETTPPDGYKKLNKYTTITITATDVNQDEVKEATVLNYLDNGISLPTTGGIGTSIFMISGIAFIVLAGVIFLVFIMRSRKTGASR